LLKPDSLDYILSLYEDSRRDEAAKNAVTGLSTLRSWSVACDANKMCFVALVGLQSSRSSSVSRCVKSYA